MSLIQYRILKILIIKNIAHGLIFNNQRILIFQVLYKADKRSFILQLN